MVDFVKAEKEPYEIVIEKNHASKAKRLADQTREELDKVLKRVENTLIEYDNTIRLKYDKQSSIYQDELDEFQNIFNDQIAKYKYKQKLTIFIVGQSKAIEQKNNILKQLNDFFTEQKESFKDSEIEATTLEFDLDTVAQDVGDCLSNANNLAKHLKEINEEIIQYLVHASANKQTKGKKKMEKALKDAKDELNTLTDKLQNAQNDSINKDIKIQELIKELEVKTAEANKYKSPNDPISNKGRDDKLLKEDLKKKDAEITQLKEKLKNMERDILNLTKRLKDKVDTKFSEIGPIQEITNNEPDEKLIIIKKSENIELPINLDDQQHIEQQFEQQKLLMNEIDFLKNKHEKEIEELKQLYEQQLNTAKQAIETQQSNTQQLPAIPEEIKDKKPKVVKPKVKQNKDSKLSNDIKNLYQQMNNQNENEFDDNLIDDVQLKKLEEMATNNNDDNNTINYDIDLNSKEFLDVNSLELQKRYELVRQYAINKINSLKQECKNIERNSKEKLNFLKNQFLEHKRMWETEKLVLLSAKDMDLTWDQERSGYLDQVEVAYKLQVEAQNAAANAIKQFEEFLKEEEKIDEENQTKQIELLRERSRTLTGLKREKSVLLNDSQVLDEDEAVFNEMQNSMKSRNSLRAKHLAQLEEKKASLQGLKAKVTQQFLPSSTVEIDKLINKIDNDDFDKDLLRKSVESKFDDESSISPMNYLKTSDLINRADSILTTKSSNRSIISNPILNEYIKIYDMVINFKNFVTKALLSSKKSNFYEFADALNNIRLYDFNESSNIVIQIQQMTPCIENIINLSQETFKKLTHELVSISYELQAQIKNEEKIKKNYLSELADERQRYDRLSKQQNQQALKAPKLDSFLSDSFKSNEARIPTQSLNLESENMSKISESKSGTEYKKKLQESELRITELELVISNLSQELENYKNLNNLQEKSINLSDEDIPSIMFTKLDAERNAKRLKRAMNKGMVSEREYENVFQLMDTYISIPEKRFSELVKKYIHHKKMKYIRETIEKSRESGSEELKNLIDKVDKLTQKRRIRFNENMQTLHEERIRVAVDLMNNLDNIEQQSGIFLIKPMYSFKGRNIVEEFLRLNELERIKRAEKIKKSQSAHASRLPTSKSKYNMNMNKPQPTPAQYFKSKSEFIFASKLVGSPSWNITDSLILDRETKLPLLKTSSGTNLSLTTPKILELDINRMMISQNQISSAFKSGESIKDRFLSTSTNLRSYVTINRPAGTIQKEIAFRNSSFSKPPTPINKNTPLPSINQVNAVIFQTQASKYNYDEINNKIDESILTVSYSRTNTDLIKQE